MAWKVPRFNNAVDKHRQDAATPVWLGTGTRASRGGIRCGMQENLHHEAIKGVKAAQRARPFRPSPSGADRCMPGKIQRRQSD
jgi:hypothetical protein